MKNLILILGIFFLIGCAESSKEKEAQSEQKAVLEMSEFEGFWIAEESGKREVIQFATEKDLTTGEKITKVYGVDLVPTLNYLTSAYADNDNPQVLWNDSRFEALMVRKFQGVLRVVEMNFELPSKDVLKVTLKTKDKASQRTYVRASRSPDLEKEFRKVQFARANKILQDFLGARSDSTCELQWKYFKDRLPAYEDLCLKIWLKKFGTEKTLNGFLRKAIERPSVHLIDLLIEAGADVKKAVPHGLASVPVFQGELALGIDEHGWVVYNNTHEELLEALKRHGLE